MRTRIASLSAVPVLALVIVAAGAPTALARPDGPSDLCGWSGKVAPLMAKADRQVRVPRVTERVLAAFGPGASIVEYRRMEVDLKATDPGTTKATDARTLTRNFVTYNLQVVHDGNRSTASAQVRFDGLCFRTTVVVFEGWAGSSGTDKPLKVSANKALRLAQEYRKAHPDDYPLDEPLVMMNLMQATTAPPDFGKLRWYVNYDNGTGRFSIIAVYMDGTVKPV
jgi:hypothetical protein